MIVPTDWWRTPYNAVSWIYLHNSAGDKKPQYRGSLFLRPLSLRTVTSAQKRPSYSKERGRDDDITLNIDLVGVKAALESVVKYERNVGFYVETLPGIQPHELEPFLALDLLSRVIDEEDTRIHKERWNELLEDLMHSPLQEINDSDESSELATSCSSLGDLVQSTSTLSSLDLTSSECSVESQAMPSTPKAKSSSHHHVEIRDLSPTGSLSGGDHTFSRSLSASASSFIPSLSFQPYLNDESVQFPSLKDSLTVSANLSNFTFPTLNVPVSSFMSVPSVKLRKDSDGFFTEESPNTTPTSLLPPFLQESSHRINRTRKSRTREIVDRLRSESVPNEEDGSTNQTLWNGISPKYASYSPSPLLDDSALEKRTTPRRSVSEDGSSNHRHQHWPSLSTTSLSASGSASTSVSVTTSRFSTPEAEDDDGWIDVTRPTHLASSPCEKSKRTRELFLALTRRRTDSVSSEGVTSPSTNLAVEGFDTCRQSDIILSESSLPSPKTPSCANKESAKTVPTPSHSAVTGAVASGNGWIERPSRDFFSKPQKEKTSKKEALHRRKSSAHNHNYTSLGQSPSWGRGSTFQHPPPHPLNHGQPQHHLPLTPFQPASIPSHTHSQGLSHPHPHPLALPSNAAGPSGLTPMPYVFGPYPVAMPVGVPMSSVPYPAAYNVMHVPTPYAMPMTQPYITPPATSYGQVHVNSISTMKGPAVSMNSGIPMPVPVGTGYGGTRGKISSGSW